jgi:integrase
MKGNLTRRGQRSWRLKFDTGSDPAGRRITKFVTLRGTRRQTQEEATKILASIATGTHVDTSRESVAQFAERWLKDWADDNVSNKTWTCYAQLLRKHLCTRVGAVQIQKLRAADLQGVYAAMAKDGLADRTRLHLHRVTHTMLKHAAQWGVVARNVASTVDAPRVKAHEVEILTPTQIQTVLDTLRGKSLYPIVATALGTGLRRGELLALRWQDVDLDNAHLRVERTLEQTKRGGLLFKAPKTKYGRRLVTLPPSTVTLLREHRKAQLELRVALGLGKLSDDALVFPNWDGSTRSPNGVTKEWALAMRKAGLKATLHSLRHTHASTLIASGLDVLTISRRLGHGSPAITLGIYGHLFKPDDRAAQIMEKALIGAERSAQRLRPPND